MKFLNRTIFAAFIWGVIGFVLVVFPIYAFGSSSATGYFFVGQTSTPLSIPSGWFLLGMAFVCSFVLADAGEAIKALVISEIITLVALDSTLTLYPPPGIFPSTADSALFFGLLGIFLFVAGMTGSVLGSLTGSFVKDVPGEWVVKLRRRLIAFDRHAIVSLGLILVLAVSLSLLGIESAIAAERGMTNLVTVADVGTSSWSIGAQRVWANFTGGYGRGGLYVTWNSYANMTFHYLISDSSELTARPVCDQSCWGRYYFSLDNLPRASTAWFQVESCPTSGCPSTSFGYEIQYGPHI